MIAGKQAGDKIRLANAKVLPRSLAPFALEQSQKEVSQIGIGTFASHLVALIGLTAANCSLGARLLSASANASGNAFGSRKVLPMVAELTTSLQLLQLLSFVIASFLPLGVSGVALDSTSCDGNCIQEMERLIEATPTSYIGGSILYRNERTFITQFFRAICDSYRDVDECLQRCEQRSKQVAELKSAYSGLQFVCKERKEEFFNSLPCLSENESKGVRKCSDQISQSQETTQLFTNSITSREFHSMQMRFSALCRDLSAVIRCLLPVINDSCGDRAANLLLKFIGLEFSSFESLYRQLGFNTPLPVSCRSLIKHAMVSDQGALQKVPSRPPVKFYKFYLNGEMCRPMAGWLLITILLLLSTIAITLTLPHPCP